jgi:His-Xaa-Ser system protein HxsD
MKTTPTIVELGGTVALEVDPSLYSVNAVLRAAYRFTDRCYVFLARAEDEPPRIVVTLTAKDGKQAPAAWIGELSNELIDQQLREELGRETQLIRELIVAQAFAEGNLLDQGDEDGYEQDPLGIARCR